MGSGLGCGVEPFLDSGPVSSTGQALRRNDGRGLVGGAGAVGVGLFGPRIGVWEMFALLTLFALELAALAAGEVPGVRFRVLGMGQIALTPIPVSSTGQALSHDGRGGRCGGRRGV